jgi:LPS sulfotransferase NodH
MVDLPGGEKSVRPLIRARQNIHRRRRVRIAMVPFVIVADLRTGSTLLSTSLDRHPQVRCRGELFHRDDLPDNGIEGLDRADATAAAILRGAFRGVERARGFKAMTFLPLPSERRWPDAWDRLGAVRGLRALWLARRDRLAQYASLEVARRTGVFHPHDHDRLYRPEHRPAVTIDPRAFRAWVRERDALLARRRAQLGDVPSLELEYESLARDWERTVARVQAFLEVDVLPLAPVKRKQESRPLTEVIRNYAELRAGLAALTRSG